MCGMKVPHFLFFLFYIWIQLFSRFSIKTTKHPFQYPFLKYYPKAEEFLGFEGGMIYKSVKKDEYIVIVDNGTMAGMLDDDDLDLLDQLVTVIEFNSEEELNTFLGEQYARFKKPVR